MKRKIIDDLKFWKTEFNRKPLILYGVRQCGKTYILKQFGQTEFTNYHYINFDKNQKSLTKIFTQDLDPKRIIGELSLLLDSNINILQDLLILDEIQACPNAISSLKYFNEELPELAICSAGSLLGLQLNETSFPVGKVKIIHMHPMSFDEFISATEQSQLIEHWQKINLVEPIANILHQRLLDTMKIYFVTGGLPEVIYTYIHHQGPLFEKLNIIREKQLEIIDTYVADFAKHSGKVNAMHISRIWQEVPNQLASTIDGSAKKFKFKGIVPNIRNYARIANALDWLQATSLVLKTHITDHAAAPLKAYIKDNSFKLYMFDIGVLGAMCELSPKAILEHDYGLFKGFFIENFVAQELIAAGVKNLYCWAKAKAEIEFILSKSQEMLPIEVKSGKNTKSWSLKSFKHQYNPKRSFLFSTNEFKLNNESGLHKYPLYLAGKFGESLS